MFLAGNLLPQILIILVSIIDRAYIAIIRKILIVLERFEGFIATVLSDLSKNATISSIPEFITIYYNLLQFTSQVHFLITS